MPFIVYNSVEAVQAVRDARENAEEHFGSYKMAEAYFNGLIDWDGNELCDYHGSSPCHCNDWPAY